LFEKDFRLLVPYVQSRLVNRHLQLVNLVPRIKATAKIARSRGVGDPIRSQGIQKGLVVATKFNVLQTMAPAKGVVRNVQNVIGFVIGSVDFQQM